MNLSQLYYFQKLAELQHYTHAAEELFISQPTLSHAISSLEEDLGCELFRKQGRNVRLTEDGAVFKEYVDESLSVLEDGVAALQIRQGRLSGTVQVGAIATVRADYLPAMVMDYRRKRGKLIELRIQQGTSHELVESLLAGKLDMAIAAKVEDARIAFTKLYNQSLGVIVQQDHPLAKRNTISLSELAKYEVYTYRADLPVGIRLDAFFRANGMSPAKMRLNRDSDDEVMLGGIVSREPVVGLCLLTSSLLPYRNLKVLSLKEPSARDFYSIGVLRLADARLTPVAKDFLAHMEQFSAPSLLLPEKG